MSSIFGTIGSDIAPAYAAAKHGVVGLTKSAALAYGKQGIRINSVGPGLIKTPLLSFADEETETRWSDLHAVGQMGDVQEVANDSATIIFSHPNTAEQSVHLTGGIRTATRS